MLTVIYWSSRSFSISHIYAVITLKYSANYQVFFIKVKARSNYFLKAWIWGMASQSCCLLSSIWFYFILLLVATFQYFPKNGNAVPKCLDVSYKNILLNVLFPVDIPFTALHPCMFSEFYIFYLIISVSSVLLNISIYSKAICVWDSTQRKSHICYSVHVQLVFFMSCWCLLQILAPPFLSKFPYCAVSSCFKVYSPSVVVVKSQY